MKFRAEDIQWKHVVIAGISLYFLSFCIGIGSTGIGLEDLNSFDDASGPEVSEMTVPASFLKKIFLNNLGLNAIIILGAFSLMAFSMIVLIFNALHVGMLVKGIYTSYGLRLAATLVMPHLVMEVVSHILSLYLAYLILQRIMIPVLLKGDGIEIYSFRIGQILALISLIIVLTFLGALIEIYVTPKLI
jgi:uncharacterized membrane protein SpoIIM required for sporulation